MIAGQKLPRLSLPTGEETRTYKTGPRYALVTNARGPSLQTGEETRTYKTGPRYAHSRGARFPMPLDFLQRPAAGFRNDFPRE